MQDCDVRAARGGPSAPARALGVPLSALVRSTVSFLVAAAVGVAALAWLGVVSFRLPFDLDPTTEDREVALGEPAEVLRVEPIALDCRARTTARVPVEGRKEHRLVGQVYRTDTLEMTAIGDIDTCVEAGAVTIVHGDDGRSRVDVPAEAIRFVRPRVDATATVGSVHFDKGLVGKVVDALPWVDDAEGLTAAGYAFAQETIGSSECMRAAYARTVEAVSDAYAAQARELGLDPSTVTVRVVGTPDFDQHGPSVLDGFAFDVADDVVCTVAGGPAGPSDERA